jgi:hypothetical protein
LIRPLFLAALVLLAAPLATPALSLVSAERPDATRGRGTALHVFTYRQLASGELAGAVPLVCDMAVRPRPACIPSGAVAAVLGMAGRDCGPVDPAGLRACLGIAADLNGRGDALHVWRRSGRRSD